MELDCLGMVGSLDDAQCIHAAEETQQPLNDMTGTSIHHIVIDRCTDSFTDIIKDLQINS